MIPDELQGAKADEENNEGNCVSAPFHKNNIIMLWMGMKMTFGESTGI